VSCKEEQTMISPNHVETTVLEWTVALGTVIFCAGYLWHRLKQAFPEFFKKRSMDADKE
jgi:hypothetical protein